MCVRDDLESYFWLLFRIGLSNLMPSYSHKYPAIVQRGYVCNLYTLLLEGLLINAHYSSPHDILHDVSTLHFEMLC